MKQHNSQMTMEIFTAIASSQVISIFICFLIDLNDSKSKTPAACFEGISRYQQHMRSYVEQQQSNRRHLTQLHLPFAPSSQCHKNN